MWRPNSADLGEKREPRETVGRSGWRLEGAAAIVNGLRRLLRQGSAIDGMSNCAAARVPLSIGIGGHLAMPPLPHHRAYGSVPRRFGGLSTRQLFHGKQAQTTEARFSEGAMQTFREAQPPRSLWDEDSRTGRPFGDLEPTEFAIALTACL